MDDRVACRGSSGTGGPIRVKMFGRACRRSRSRELLDMPLLRTLLLNGTLGLAGYWTARHGFRMPPGLPRGLAAVTIAWAWATLGMEVLGPPGFLAYGPLLAWTSAGLAVAIVLRLRDPGGRGDVAVVADADAGPGGPWEPAASLALGLVLWATTMHGLSSLLGPVNVV